MPFWRAAGAGRVGAHANTLKPGAGTQTLCEKSHTNRVCKEGVFIYFVLDKAKSNLAIARRKMQDIEKDLNF